MPGWAASSLSDSCTDSLAPCTQDVQPREGQKAERPQLGSHLSPRLSSGNEACKAALLGNLGEQLWRRGAWQRASHASIWLVSSESQQETKTFTHTGGQDFQEGVLSCATGMEGCWGGLASAPCLVGALGSVGGVRWAPCRGAQAEGQDCVAVCPCLPFPCLPRASFFLCSPAIPWRACPDLLV